MCGIAGIFRVESNQGVDRAQLETMLEPMSHRGPDGRGYHLEPGVGLAHLRLAIIDVDGGPQPMANEDETVWIVFNGEIYNFESLREDLLARGHVFRSKCDTEVIIHLYEEYGTDCVNQLRGMFAFAIWDRKRRRLFLARDRVGIKPLYVCSRNGSFYFASELKAIVAEAGGNWECDKVALRDFFSFYYVPNESTLLTSVKRLAPGNMLVVEAGKVTESKYWDLVFPRPVAPKSFDDSVNDLYALIGSTVKDHMIADVPVGILLSGGLDSSSILSFAVQGTSKKIRTFTVGFDGAGVVDERPYARKVADHFGTEHFEISITAEDFWNFLPDYIWHMEEPVCEPPAIALHYVSKLARRHVKVLLSGEGGDEAFAGYATYPNHLRLDDVNLKLGFLAPLLGSTARATGRATGSVRLQRYATAFGKELHEHYYSRSSSPASYFNHHAKKLFSPDFLRDTAAASPAAFMKKLLAPTASWSVLSQMLYADTKTWLPNDLLLKADKITMANSLELRVPLLDHKVLEFAAALPTEYKVNGKDTKRILKAALAKVLPPEIVNRKKAGFPVPYGAWLQGPLAARVRDLLLSHSSATKSMYRRPELERLLTENERSGLYSREVFSLVIVELWHRRFAAN